MTSRAELHMYGMGMGMGMGSRVAWWHDGAAVADCVLVVDATAVV